ncbi:uncharacterized protein LOC119496401 isoform X4 [Sebastes umbrosus]|uniref:uncharacterized protein LOC119496401 isoform X4 n=1 Tax=Sebastes umbrosus TaxID=72105 RepID=UPI0018A065AF|nr:uncharacterized protein LOC119496401 isoform X4 [Sebastes umbrosus]XP_037639609.1 uncharacterized protein LOC119496401 isoform X4 [Sebastes umbrosus]
MVELGFRHFVGVDSSKLMLEQAAKTGLYQDLKLALLGTEPLPTQTAGPAIRNGPPAVWCRLPTGTGRAARRSSSTGRRRSRSCQAQSSLPPAGAPTAGRIGSEAGSASVRGTFDVVVIIGALREGHVPVSILRELSDAAKPGGYICMSRSDSKSECGKEYKVSMEKELQQMEEEGLWTHVMTEEMHKYMMDFDGDEYLRGTMHLYKKSLV